MEYVGRAPIIINKTLTSSNVWYKVTDEIKGVRKWKMKARESTFHAFDYDYTTTHLTHITNGGAGISADGCSLPLIYARSATAGVVIELEYWN